MQRVLLTRHAESEFSVRGLTNGDPSVACGLTVEGRAQAQRLGELLADAPLDLCVTSEFERTRETAEIVLAGRSVPRLVLPALNDIRFGEFEGKPLADYRAWAHAHGPGEPAPGGGESRVETVRRYVDAYRDLLARSERTILVVAHGLPVRYVLDAAAGRAPAPAVAQVPYAVPFTLQRDDLSVAVARLEAWVLAPGWT
jgi:2,3-bisphosphoglycerate-dependent phosphoglycerate mutase